MRWLRWLPLVLETGVYSRRKQAFLWLALLGGAAVGFKLSHRWQEYELERVRKQVSFLEQELQRLQEATSTAARGTQEKSKTE
jgi:hypothetical protein